jgi:hypothetical protein
MSPEKSLDFINFHKSAATADLRHKVLLSQLLGQRSDIDDHAKWVTYTAMLEMLCDSLTLRVAKISPAGNRELVRNYCGICNGRVLANVRIWHDHGARFIRFEFASADVSFTLFPTFCGDFDRMFRALEPYHIEEMECVKWPELSSG